MKELTELTVYRDHSPNFPKKVCNIPDICHIGEEIICHLDKFHLHIWDMRDVENSCTFVAIFCCDLRTFVAKSVFCDLHTFVWRKIEPKIAYVEKK